MTHQRDTAIDCMKGILIILVVIGHGISLTAHNMGFLNALIYSFHMPAFIMISGWTHNQQKWSEKGFVRFAIRRFRTLMIPYLLFDLLAGIVRKTASGKWSTLNPFGILHEILILAKESIFLQTHSIADWFLPALFTGELLFFLILEFSRKAHFKKEYTALSLFSIATAVFSCTVIHFFSDIPILRRIGVVGIVLLFLVSGRYFKNRNLKCLNIKGRLAAACILLICAAFNGKVLISTLEMRSLILLLISGPCGFLLLCSLAQRIHSRFFLYCGENSLVIYGTHYNIRWLIKRYCSSLSDPLFFLCYFGAVILGEAVLIPVYNLLIRPLIRGKRITAEN